MPRALIVHYNPAEALPLAERVHREGFEPEIYQQRGPKGFRGIRANPPDAIVIDLTRMPSYGRGMGVLLRESKSLRTIPLVFVEGDPGKAALVRQMLPDTVVAQWQGIGAALRRSVATRTAEPAAPVPPDTPLHRKLKIREGAAVALLHAPKGIEAKLAPLPDGVRFQTRPDGAETIMIFAKSAAAFGRELPALAAAIGRGRTLWVVWPKKASATPSDLSMPAILEMCRLYGLAVGKVCALDETWSAMAFSRARRATRGTTRTPDL